MQLIYRGYTYEYIPASMQFDCQANLAQKGNSENSKVKLIYRGQTYEYNRLSMQSITKPCAVNWRYQVA